MNCITRVHEDKDKDDAVIWKAKKNTHRSNRAFASLRAREQQVLSTIN